MNPAEVNALEAGPRAELEAHQLGALRQLLGELVPSNAFHAPRVQAAGLNGGFESLADFRRLPFTLKSELADDQRANPPYGTNLTQPLESYVRLHQTSSTTGQPLRWLDTERGWSWMLKGWQQVFRIAGLDKSDRFFFAFSFGPFIGLWMAFHAAERMGCLCIPGGAMNSVMRLKAILTNDATVLCCTPTYAARLGEVAREEDIDLSESKVRAIVVGGEPGASVPAVRKRIEASWPGAKLYDHHGMTEVGPVSHPCPAHENSLHVMESAYYAELADPQTGELREAGSNELSELVLTPLGRNDSPVLRYRTGDLVRGHAGPCACGFQTMRLEGGVLARADEMLVVRGVNLYPAAVDQVVRAFDEVEEYRVEVGKVREMVELNIDIEPKAGLENANELCGRVQAALKKAYNLRIPVTAVAQGELPRFELKAKRWVKRDSA